MKRLFVLLLLVSLIFVSTQTDAQISRKPQIEIYMGANFPISPEEFKDYFSVGLSLNAQYVLFPSPRLGIPIFFGYEKFTVNTDKINTDYKDNVTPVLETYLMYMGYQLTNFDVESEGSASSIRIGVGIRPYLTPPEAETQIFLFGNATFNILKTKLEATGGSASYDDLLTGTPYIEELSPSLLAELGFPEQKTDENKFGLGGGVGLEIPFGEQFNVILQALMNIIFTEDENTVFLGLTGGLAF